MQPLPGSEPTGAQGPIETDALVIGAGPVGLFQVFQLGLLDIRAHVLDALPFAGGQCAQLYGDKPIFDIPAITSCTGHELTQRLLQQAAVFSPQYHWNQLVERVHPRADGRFDVHTAAGLLFCARSLFITTGTGAFVPRKPKLADMDALEGLSIFHGIAGPGLTHGVTFVLGDSQEAVERAVNLASEQRPVVLSHRRDQFDVNEACQRQLRQQVALGRLELCIGMPIALAVSECGLVGIRMALHDGTTVTVDCSRIETYLGVSPTLAPLKQWNIDLDRKAVRIDPASGSTSLAGIFAAGDVCHYAGKKKLIVSGFHEACMAAYGAQALLWPGQVFPLQYTSSSTHLHALLGVKPD